MKKLFIALLFVMFVGTVSAQTLGSRYLWTHKLAATTSAVDSTFNVRWEFVTVYSDTLDLWLKIGAPDTSGWSSRSWIKLEGGTSLFFERPIYLKRMEWKTVSGSGYLYLIGGKKQKQF